MQSKQAVWIAAGCWAGTGSFAPRNLLFCQEAWETRKGDLWCQSETAGGTIVCRNVSIKVWMLTVAILFSYSVYQTLTLVSVFCFFSSWLHQHCGRTTCSPLLWLDGMEWLDLTTAFDTVDPNILLSRLQNQVGSGGTALNLFRSYLKGRTFSAIIAGFEFSSALLSCGVPQGPILGPLLFSLYLLPLGPIFRKYGISFHCSLDDCQS